MNTRCTLAMTLAAALAAGGCGSSAEQAEKPGTQTRTAARGERPADPVRITALRERAIATLTEYSSDVDPQVRANVIEALVVAPARLEPIAAAGLRDSNEGVRAVAAMAVGKARLSRLASAVEPLLSDPSPRVQTSAIFAMRRLGREADPTPLASFALGDPRPSVRAHAVWALGELGDPSALPLLREVAARPMPRAGDAEVRLLRLQVAEAMLKLGDDDQLHPLHAALFVSRPEHLETAALAAQILGEVGNRSSIPDLRNLAVYRDEQGNQMPAEVRLAAAGALAKLGQTDGSFIAEEYASNPSPLVRAQAAVVFGETTGPNNAARLEALLRDPDERVRVAAAAGVLRYAERSAGR
ncbi:MAG: HEAT repeat domain-containing protein [Phycisphaeraceae bacterium]|nr:HEAT repeat domain-containing protein [Phycisphaeraceae bacterium]